MSTGAARASPLILARVAGFLYLLVVPLGIFSLYVDGKLTVLDDAAATANNLMASISLYRLGIVSNVLAVLILILVVLILFKLLAPVSKSMAMLMVMFLMAVVPIGMLCVLFQLAALHVLGGADYLKVFTTEQVQALALLFLRLNDLGGTITYIFWGLWLLPMGYLVFKSGVFPRILGVFLMISCFGYVADSFATLLGHQLGVGLLTAGGEILFILWLVIKGVNAEQWEKRALESA